MIAPPRPQTPDYSHIAQRGAIIGNAVEKSAQILGQTVTTAIQEYKQNRSLDTAYKGVRGMVLDQQEKYGLSDKQADAMMSRLKYKEGEGIVAYENRIRPVLSNMALYDEYLGSSDYQFKMPDPFLESGVFKAAMDINLQKRKEREVGDVAEGFAGVQTQEQAQRLVAEKMPGRAVSEQELLQQPGYRALSTQVEMDKAAMGKEAHEVGMAGKRAATDATIGQEERRKEMHPLDMDYRQAQIDAMRAETQRRQATTLKLKALAGSGNKKNAVDELKDIQTIARLEIAAKELLKDMPKYDEMDDSQSGLSEEYLDMKELADVLKTKRNEVMKMPAPQQTAKVMEEQINREIDQVLEGRDESEDYRKTLQAQKIHHYAKQKFGVDVPYQKVLDALRITNRQGKQNTVADVMDRILKRAGGNVGR